MPRLRAAALLALLAAACASTPKAGEAGAKRPADYQSRYDQCMNVAWGSGIEWETRKAMCRAQAQGDDALGAANADGKTKSKK